jgi:hypothetical protein
MYIIRFRGGDCLTRFDGRGLLESYSCEMLLTEPVHVYDLDVLLGLPESYGSNLIAVRGSRKLDAKDIINDNEEIILFLAVMGG